MMKSLLTFCCLSFLSFAVYSADKMQRKPSYDPNNMNTTTIDTGRTVVSLFCPDKGLVSFLDAMQKAGANFDSVKTETSGAITFSGTKNGSGKVVQVIQPGAGCLVISTDKN
jgi:hypothetical protein